MINLSFSRFNINGCIYRTKYYAVTVQMKLVWRDFFVQFKLNANYVLKGLELLKFKIR